MRYGIRVPSLKGRVSARLSPARMVRHRMGVKMPRGMGFATNPKKFVYNKVYNRTSVSVDRLVKGSHRRASSAPIPVTPVAAANPGCGCSLLTWAIVLTILFPPVGIILLIVWAVQNQTPEKQAEKREWAGNVAAKNGKIDEAVSIYKEVKQIDPKRTDIDWKIGGLLNNSGRFEEAIPYLEEFVKNNSDDTSAKVILSNCLVRTPSYKKAIPLLQSIQEEESEFQKAMQLLSACFEKEKKLDVAIETLKRGIGSKRKLDDQLIELYYNLGVLYKKKGDKPKAKQYLEKVYGYKTDFLDTEEVLKALDFK